MKRIDYKPRRCCDKNKSFVWWRNHLRQRSLNWIRFNLWQRSWIFPLNSEIFYIKMRRVEWQFVCFIILNKNLVFGNFCNFSTTLFEIYVRFAKIKCNEFADEQKHNCRLAPPPSHLYLFPFTCTFSSKSVWEIFSINIHPNSNLLLIFSHL